MVAITCPAVFMDRSDTMLKEVFSVCAKLIRDGTRDPLPAGATHWGKALEYMEKKGFESAFWECVDLASEIASTKEERQPFIRRSEEYHAATAGLCNEVGRKLYNSHCGRRSCCRSFFRTLGPIQTR